VPFQDTPTTWWSIHDMLDRINQSKTCLKMVEIEEEISLSKENYLTESEWKTIPYVVELLQSFKEHQKKLEVDRYVSISWFPCLSGY
jgi:hypothetical protein